MKEFITYPATIEPDEDGYGVEFPDLPGCLTCADSYEQALAMAREALSGYLACILEEWDKIIRPSSIAESQIAISPEPDIALALWLRWQREDRQLSQEQMAKQCELDMPTYQRLESANEPAMKILTKLEHGLGEHVLAL